LTDFSCSNFHDWCLAKTNEKLWTCILQVVQGWSVVQLQWSTRVRDHLWWY
jgi:hypothetical protein